MKIKKLISFAAILLAFTACTSNSDFNYSPVVEVLYSPIRLNDSATIVIKKGATDNIKIDSMNIGDTISFQVHLFDLKYSLKSVTVATEADTSTLAILPSGFDNGSMMYNSKVMTDNLEFLYIARKSNKTGHITIFLETENIDSIFGKDSLRINTPVKFL